MSPTTHPAVSIVGLAARTPVGLTAPAAAAAVRAGVSRVGAHPFMLDARGEPLRMAVDPRLDPMLRGGRRLAALARATLAELDAQLGSGTLGQAEVLLALPENRPGFGDEEATEVLAGLEPTAGVTPPVAVTVRGRGHAGVMQALSVALERLGQQRIDLCVVIGVDSYADADTIDWLEGNRQLLGEEVRSGFIPGEAAGAIALTTTGGRRSFRLTSLANVRGVGTAFESRLIKTQTDVLGQGLHAAIAAAGAHLRGPEEGVDDIYTDINGERYRTDEWGLAALRLGTTLRTTNYHAPTTCWGDVGAASGALGCVLAVQSWRRGYAEGPRALVWGSSEGGLRGAVVLEAPRA